MLQPQKHVGLPRCSDLSSIRNWILCLQAPLVHSHHSSFLFTNVCLRKFLALRRFPFPLRALRLRTAPRQNRRRLPGEAKNVLLQFETVGIFAQEKKAFACFCNRCVLSALHWHFRFPGRVSGIWNLRVRVTKFHLRATHSRTFSASNLYFRVLTQFNPRRSARLECLLSYVVRSDWGSLFASIVPQSS